MSLPTFIDKNRGQIESLLPVYIARQRWFGGKSRTIASTRIASTAPIHSYLKTLNPELLDELCFSSVIALIEVSYIGSAEPDLYQLPLSLATNEQAVTLQSTAPKSIIATLDGNILFDASADTDFQQSLLHFIVEGSSTNNLNATRSTALDPTRFSGLSSRLSSAEQSNTSILYPPLAILKLFRHLRPGAENPDVEIARFLTETAHFNGTPTYLGDLHRASDSTTLAFLQAFAPNDGDGWAWTLTQLEDFYNSVSSKNLPSAPEREARSEETPAFEASKDFNLSRHVSLEAATLIGRRTAELHLALATPTQDPAFAVEPYTVDDLTRDHQRISAQINSTLDQLNAAIPKLAPEVSTNAKKLLGQRRQLLTRVDALTGDPSTFGYRVRIHGDYHLGQLLRTADDFLIVDFEGEPARSLAERRQKQSPLRDVAGMLRSFSYVARTGLANAVRLHPTDVTSLTHWSTAWETAVSTTFLNSYNEIITTQPNLIPQQANTLLNALLLEKALYELLYELNNRPAWLPIPLEGLLQIAAISNSGN